ncbi:MAG: vWA domain-containing protein [Planctomycetota bacterium]|jgi:uncharacterized protein with von Willebrand factor type A (vWA) domain
MRSSERPEHDGGAAPRPLGGVIHTYQRYDPKRLPPPLGDPPDVVSGAFGHLMTYGSLRRLTEEELARAVHLDASQIQGLGPSLDALIAMLEQRKAKILATYETDGVLREAGEAYRERRDSARPPRRLESAFRKAAGTEQLRDLERLWYRVDDETSSFARTLLHLVERLGEKYQVEELASKYEFTGRTSMSVAEALEIKEQLEMIDALLEQLREAMRTAQIAVIDIEALERFAEPQDVASLRAFQQQVQDYLREVAERQGLELTAEGYKLTPKAFRLFQSALLTEIFSELQASRSGRHTGPIVGEGAVEMPRTRPYEFGDSVVHMDATSSMINAMIRSAAEGGATDGRVRMKSEDIEIHLTRNNPKCATVVIIDMSGSMRYGGQYVNAKRMALALDGLIRTEYPGDYLQFVEMYSFAKVRHISELPGLMPKPVTVYDPVVRLKADMSDERITEMDVPPHFTNIQHALQQARRLLVPQDTPNRQVVLITDGLPTAHFEEQMLYLLYPPHPRTEEATMREALLCARERITINVMLVPSWSQTHEDVQFAQRMAESTQGRVIFTGGDDLDRFVIWDYVTQRRKIIG